jgi:3',5'-cyclic AMP phosphodiesterase CpdA
VTALTRIAHLSDVHFGAADPAVVGGLVAELAAFAPDLVVISGDLTMGARRWEFRAARAFIDRLGAPTLCVPGNHDITPYRLVERFLVPWARWHDEIAADTEPVWRDARVGVVGLNTARRGGAHLDWSRGRVTLRRLKRVLARLDALPPGLVRIVVAHHPLLPPPGETSPQVAGNAARALAAFAAHGVRLVLAGHLHRSYSRAGTQGPAPLVLQGGSATSVRLRGEPNAYNRITVAADGAVRIEGRVWTGTAWADAPTPPLTLERWQTNAGADPARSPHGAQRHAGFLG